MKIRIFKKLVDNVFNIRIQTEDWSEEDKLRMVKLGEPEIDLGGSFTFNTSSSEDSSTVVLDSIYARILSESPFTHKFDTRDYKTFEDTRVLANVWATAIENRIIEAVTALRAKDITFTTEEITEY